MEGVCQVAGEGEEPHDDPPHVPCVHHADLRDWPDLLPDERGLGGAARGSLSSPRAEVLKFIKIFQTSFLYFDDDITPGSHG